MYEPTIRHFSELAWQKAMSARRSPVGFFVGAMLAGAYIGIAMILALSVAAGLPLGWRPFAMGAVFGLGLILTVFAGAELFTGYVMYLGFGLARGTIGVRDAVRMLPLVWFGNLAGSVLLASLFVSGGGGTIFADGATMLRTYAAHKVDADMGVLLARGTLCNWLVCLAIWTAARVSGDTAKCIVLAWVLMAFVASGFEHSVANMTALSLGWLLPASPIGLPGVVRNLALVTLGNFGGGLVFVVGSYLTAARSEGADSSTGAMAGGTGPALSVAAE